ncbi:MAG: DnaJ domain-containing protein [Acidobacteriota bacterium]
MTSPKSLDLKGNFRNHPFAELLAEVLQAKLSGSLRLAHAKKKSIIYFRDGAVVYAVSNAREQRLFSVLLNRKKIDQKTLAQFPNLANDLELAAELEAKRIFTKSELNELVVTQIESIIVDALTWTGGEWAFSPLTRLREDLNYKPDIYRILIDYARCLPSQDVYLRFRSVQEAFYREPKPPTGTLLQSHEQYVLDEFKHGQLTIEEVRPICSLPETAMLQSLYVLWLGGILVRRDWNSAFSATKIGEILTSKVSLVKSADRIESKVFAEAEVVSEAEPAEPMRLPEPELSLEDYLERIEKAETLYDILGIADNAKPGDIKNAYFAMAKLFHPDRFHREEAVKLRRIQVAFTEIAHAYETLKTDESRENYNFKMRKELEYREKRRAAVKADATAPEDRQAEEGLGSFEQAMDAINEEEYAAAAGHLSRAVHYSPQNALFHAYFGYALSHLEKQQHKAEASLQQAVKLDPKNPKIRMMLVEFFVVMKMAKRAEGELKRFLELVPGNKEATKMLAGIQAEA